MNARAPMTRRTFGTAVALAAGFPAIMPRPALGGAGAAAPSDRIGVAFIGPGRRGSQLVREFAGRSDVEPVAICDVWKERREKMLALVQELTRPRRDRGQGGPACALHTDFRDVLDRKDVDGVIVSAPEHWRAIMCIMAAKAGKDIFTEKPFALTIGEAKALYDAVRRYGRVFQHCTQRRSNNEQKLRDSCELARNGRIGRVTHAVVSVGPAPLPDFPDYAARAKPPDPEVLDWDLWLGPAPWRPYQGEALLKQWQTYRDFGLRSIGNWGSHVLDMAQWALGKDAEGPIEIIPPSGTESRLTITYADGLAIYCPRTEGDSANTAVFGTEGQKIIFASPKIEEKYDRTPIGPDEIHLYRPRNDDHNGNWLECMRTRARTICNEEVAYRSGSLVLLIAMSDLLKRPLRYDPEKAEFPGDDEANRLRDTAKRGPWQIY